MLFSRIPNNVRKRQSAWLYSVVFNGALSTCIIFLLLLSFFIQPFHKAFAAEPEVTEEAAPVAEDVKAQEEQAEPVEEVQPTEIPDASTDMSETPTEEVLEIPQDSTEEVSDPVEDVDVSVDDTSTSAGEEIASSTDDNASSEEVRETEENKKEKKEQVVQVESLVTEDNFYQFSKQSCVEVGGGTYHCTTSTEGVTDARSVAYAERDSEGDMEIFVRTSKSRVKQLTDNGYDDTSPHYDPESMRVVWQRSIDGRQQIVLFDIVDEKESQLTFPKTNNMEPKVSDAGIVWQAWDNNDWEIMYFDGTYTEQLTENEAQDVAPVIQDSYVLWNVLGGDEQQARLYDLDTKETISIEGHEGGTISNPRFVLVYDTEYENGDIVTQSLDPTTGLSEPVAARPAPEPVSIPESDPIGEIRALITNKSKDEQQFLDVDSGDDGNSGASSTDSGALNLKSSSDDGSVAPATIDMSSDFELTEYDLVIPEGAFEQALEEAASSTQQ